MNPYLPGATFIDLGPDGGTYDETAHPKGCIHTTEGPSLSGAESAYRNYPPHIGYDPNTRVIHQYVRLDRYSYAFKGAESDDEFVIQVELVGFAAQTHTYSEQWYRNVGEDIIRPLREIVGIPNNYLTFYGEGDGIVLASPSSPIRLSDSSFRTYSGWLGHQHIPAPDAHWDPGRFRMDLALHYSESDMPITDDDARKIWFYGIEHPHVSDPANPGHGVKSAAKDVLWGNNEYLQSVPGRLTTIEENLDILMAKMDELSQRVALSSEDVKAAAKEGTTLALAEGTVDVDVTIAGNPTVAVEGNNR